VKTPGATNLYVARQKSNKDYYEKNKEVILAKRRQLYWEQKGTKMCVIPVGEQEEACSCEVQVLKNEYDVGRSCHQGAEGDLPQEKLQDNQRYEWMSCLTAEGESCDKAKDVERRSPSCTIQVQNQSLTDSADAALGSGLISVVSIVVCRCLVRNLLYFVWVDQKVAPQSCQVAG